MHPDLPIETTLDKKRFELLSNSVFKEKTV